MNFIKKIRDWFAERRLMRVAQKQKRERIAANINQAKTIAIIFDATNVDHLEVVKKFVSTLKERKKTVRAVGFFDQKFTPVNVSYSKAEFDFFNRKELNGMGLPASPYIQNFIKDEHDILVDLNIQNKFPLRGLAIQSNARFKVGIDLDANSKIHDLLITVKPEEGLVRFLSQAERYLEMINKA